MIETTEGLRCAVTGVTDAMDPTARKPQAGSSATDSASDTPAPVYLTSLFPSAPFYRQEQNHLLRMWLEWQGPEKPLLILGSAYEDTLENLQSIFIRHGAPAASITRVLCPFAFHQAMRTPDCRPSGDYQFGRRAHEIAFCKQYLQQFIYQQYTRGRMPFTSIELFVDSDTYIPPEHLQSGVLKTTSDVCITFPCCLRGQILAPDVQFAAYSLKIGVIEPAHIFGMYKTEHFGNHIARNGAPDCALKKALENSGTHMGWFCGCETHHFSMNPIPNRGPDEGIYMYRDGHCWLDRKTASEMYRENDENLRIAAGLHDVE